MLGYEKMKSSISLQKTILFKRLMNLARLGTSGQNIGRNIKRWLDIQHWADSRIDCGPQSGCNDQTFVL